MAKVRVLFSVALLTVFLALIGCQSGTSSPPGSSGTLNPAPGAGGTIRAGSTPWWDQELPGLLEVRMNPQPLKQAGGWPAAHQASSIGTQATLPKPSLLAKALAPVKQPAYDSADLVKAGADYDSALPSNRISTVVAPNVIFSPVWGSQAQPVLSDAAYCIYSFSLAGYADSGQPQTLALAWYPGSEPADFADLFVGLANPGLDRWEWYAGPKDNVLTLASFAPYTAGDGTALVAIVVLGSTECALQGLKVGETELRATGDMPGEPGEDTSPPPPDTGTLPASVDLSPDCSPIDDQDWIGSCSCFATARGAFDYELGQVYKADGWDLNDPFNRASTKYVYLQTGTDCGRTAGRVTAYVIDYLITDGDSSDQNCFYDKTCNRDWGQAAYDDAALLNAERVQGVDPRGQDGVFKVKSILATQRKPLVMSTGLDWKFNMSLGPDEVWNYSGDEIKGRHAMCIVGYNDAKQAFRVRNSWGTDFADAGYCWIGYQTFVDADPVLGLWCWTIDVDYDPAVAERFLGKHQELSPPSNVSASDGSFSDKIALTWQKSTGATGYRVYRDLQSNLVATLGNVAAWDDTGIGDDYNHTYWVKATAPGLESAFSSPDAGYLAQAPNIQNVTPQSGVAGDVVVFSAQVTGSAPLSYAWNFGGGAVPNTSSSASPQVLLGSAGGYSASLTVTNGFGSDAYWFTLSVQANTYTASGYVKTPGGTGIAGVTLSFTGGLGSVTTNASGYWTREGILNGSYTVTPSKNSYTFNPASRNFTVSNADVSVPDFTGSGSGTITILSVTTDKTTHLKAGTETPAHLSVTTNPSPADTYSWSGPGNFSNKSIANPTWKPSGSTPLGKARLTITVAFGAANDSATIDMYVTQQPIVTQWTGEDSVNRQVGYPAGSGITPDFDLSTLQYLEPLIDGGDITAGSGTFYQQIEGQVVLFKRWELFAWSCREKFPSFDTYAETYGALGFKLIANAVDTSAGSTIYDVQAWFQSNAIDFCHHYHGDINTVAWNRLGYDSWLPFCVLIDRDKRVRMVGHPASDATWENTIKELTGAIP